MSAYRYCVILCDFDKPPSGPCGEESCVEPTVALARQAAKASGWVHRKGKDYCPEHGPTTGS